MCWHFGQRTLKAREGIFDASSCSFVVQFGQMTIMAYSIMSSMDWGLCARVGADGKGRAAGVGLLATGAAGSSAPWKSSVIDMPLSASIRLFGFVANERPSSSV